MDESRISRIAASILSPSEALFGFAGWLTSLEEPVTLSARNEAGIAAELVDEFCQANDLKAPVDGWENNFEFPKSRELWSMEADHGR